MKQKGIKRLIIALLMSATILGNVEQLHATSSEQLLDAVQTDINLLTVSDEVKVVGLGEASHGVKEYQQMKAEVFKALVKNNQCKTFIIEGDFGGALKVDEYIHGASVEASEVIQEIGFGIYCTEEMVDLIKWMRQYNEAAPQGEDLHFYGMDMQRYDHNKAYLLSILGKADPKLKAQYGKNLKNLTDDQRFQISKEELTKAKQSLEALIAKMDASKTQFASVVGMKQYETAQQCAESIYEGTQLLLASSSMYNTLRDQFMAEKVKWFLQRGDGHMLFINGHNGHIGKVSTSYCTLGKRLSNELKEAYFAIGTDASETSFNSQNDDGSFEVLCVQNINALNGLLQNSEIPFYYIDFTKVVDHKQWQEIIGKKQGITSLNVGLLRWQVLLKSSYTSTVIPNEAYDGMIVYKQVSPTTLIKE